MKQSIAKPEAGKVEQSKTNRPLVLASIIVAMFIGAIEATIVATAMPGIIGDLGGFSLFTWVFSAFLLAQAITIPIYGKLADLFGRKPVFTFGVTVFLIGSLLCGFAPTMKMLILFRLIQGIGAGATLPIATTIIGDIYSVQERAKIQGYIASVWGISSIIGPVLGAIFVQYLNWAWIFWINLPLGVLSIMGIWLYLHEHIAVKRHKIDFIGSGLLLVLISSLMILLLSGGTTWHWVSVPIFSLLGLVCLMFSLFIIQEKRAEEPVMPLDIWKNPLITVANLASFTTGAVMIGITSFLPAFVQGVMGRTPAIAGFTLSMMSIGWPIASTFSGKLMLKYGYRKTAVSGAVALFIGSLFFVTLYPESGPLWAAAGSFCIGVGMGLMTTTFLVTIQSSVDWQTRGVATASNLFMRILGNTVGAAMFGGILNSQMTSYLQAKAAQLNLPVKLDVANILLDPKGRAAFPESVLAILKQGLASSLHGVYWAVLALGIVSLALVFFLPATQVNQGFSDKV